MVEDIASQRIPLSKEPLVLLDRQGLNWTTTLVLALVHIGAIAALFMFSWKAFATAVFLYWVATGLGISMGYHRLHTHRSYKVPTWMEYFFAICATLTLEGGPISGRPSTAFTISGRTSRATRTPRGKAHGGHTWAGS